MILNSDKAKIVPVINFIFKVLFLFDFYHSLKVIKTQIHTVKEGEKRLRNRKKGSLNNYGVFRIFSYSYFGFGRMRYGLFLL